jgi:hypothetical protein
MGSSTWPAAQRVPWSAPVDGILVELGENDCHSFDCVNATGRAKLAAAFVQLAHTLAAAQPAGKALHLFYTIANHEAGQSAAMGDAVVALQAAGFTNVAFLNGTSPNVDAAGANIDNGCAGHPSAAQNQLAYERIRPVLAQALGWA